MSRPDRLSIKISRLQSTNYSILEQNLVFMFTYLEKTGHVATKLSEAPNYIPVLSENFFQRCITIKSSIGKKSEQKPLEKIHTYTVLFPCYFTKTSSEIIETRLNKIANLTGKTNGSKYIQITIDHQGGEL